MSKGEGTNQETVQRQLREDAEKLHPWPPEVALGFEVSALNLYQKAQLQRSYRKWPPLDLIELARVCKLIVMADHEFTLLEREGLTVNGGRNGTTLVANPRASGLSTLNSTIMQMLRRLGIAAMSVSDKTATAQEAEVEREMRDKAPEDNSLLN